MSLPHLTTQQGFAFIGEMTSTRNLLGYGLKALREGAFFETTLDPIFTMLSIGVEKHLKLVLGALALEDSGRWPTKSEMMSFGHGIAEMWGRVMDEVRQRTTGRSEYLRELVVAVDADAVLRPFLEVLDRYGRAGRFYNLDMLGDTPQRDLAPEAMFDAVVQTALADPEVAERFTAAMANLSDQAAWEMFYAILRARIARSVEQAWEMLSRAGMHSVFGELGKVMGADLRSDAIGRQ